MKIDFDDFERDLLIETINHRLDTDEGLSISESVEEDLIELLRKIEENEYL